MKTLKCSICKKTTENMFENIKNGKIICSNCENNIDGDLLSNQESGYKLIKNKSDTNEKEEKEKKIKIRKYLTGSFITFRKEFYQHLDELFKDNDKIEMTYGELYGYFMKKFKGSCNPMELEEEIKRIL